MAAGSNPPEPIQPGEILLHVGPHKTGTSSVQSAFHLARAELARHGMWYAGPNRHPVRAAQAAIAAGSPGARPIRPWRNLLRDIARHPTERVVLSSEWFADASPEAARRIVAELGAERVQVVVTLRSLARLLPSQWQQYVQAGRAMAYEPWLREVLAEPPALAAAGFWHRHRHDQLIARWASIVGPGRVTAIVVDGRHHDAVLRAFEDVTGLPPGTLVAEEARVNRSLTLPEVELIRRLNERIRTEIVPPEGLDPTVRLNLVLFGAAAGLRGRSPEPDEPRPETPAWAETRAVALGREITAGIRSSGIRVIGDLAALTSDGGERSSSPATLDAIAWPAITAAAASGILVAAGLARHDAGGGRTDVLSTARLRAALVGRLRGWPLVVLDSVGRRAAEPADQPTESRGATAEGFVDAFDASVHRGATVLLEVIRATGLTRPPRGPAFVRRAILAERRRRTGETLELARWSTPALGRLLAGRIVRRIALR